MDSETPTSAPGALHSPCRTGMSQQCSCWDTATLKTQQGLEPSSRGDEPWGSVKSLPVVLRTRSLLLSQTVNKWYVLIWEKHLCSTFSLFSFFPYCSFLFLRKKRFKYEHGRNQYFIVFYQIGNSDIFSPHTYLKFSKVWSWLSHSFLCWFFQLYRAATRRHSPL